jgi:hypothetical protein
MDEQMQDPGIMEKIVNALRSVGAAGAEAIGSMGAPAAGTKPLRQWQEEFATDRRGHPTLESYINAGGAPYVAQ